MEDNMLNRMRFISLPVLFAMLLMGAAPMVMADDGYGTQAVNKFGRGLANTATGWIELPKNVVNTSNNSNVAVGITWGLVKGVLYTVGRTAVGAVELVTFFIPNDEFVHPNYVWNDFDQDTTFGNQ